MAAKTTWDTVRKIASAIPGVEESTSSRGMALKVGGKMLGCTAINKSAEPDSLMVRIDFDQRAALITEAPEIRSHEIGTGAYAPTSHCDMPRLLNERDARQVWKEEIQARGLDIAAFNCWGNPLHPDEDVARLAEKRGRGKRGKREKKVEQGPRDGARRDRSARSMRGVHLLDGVADGFGQVLGIDLFLVVDVGAVFLDIRLALAAALLMELDVVDDGVAFLGLGAFVDFGLGELGQ